MPQIHLFFSSVYWCLDLLVCVCVPLNTTTCRRKHKIQFKAMTFKASDPKAGCLHTFNLLTWTHVLQSFCHHERNFTKDTQHVNFPLQMHHRGVKNYWHTSAWLFNIFNTLCTFLRLLSWKNPLTDIINVRL